MCDVRKYEGEFAPYQWELAGNSKCKGGMCIECGELKKHLECSRCGQQKLPAEFSKTEQVNDEPKCKACKKLQKKEEKARAEEAKERVCSTCGIPKRRTEFSEHILKNAANASMQCTQCVNAAAAVRDKSARKDMKTCVVCELAQRQECFQVGCGTAWQITASASDASTTRSCSAGSGNV